MLNESGTDIPSVQRGHGCDCYKRLDALGIPLYIDEENDEYSEQKEITLPENAFPVPKFVSINAKVKEYPIIDDNHLDIAFMQMTEVIPELSDFETNVLSFWMLDMFLEGLQTAQNAGMSHRHQRATLEWIAYLFNYVQKNRVRRPELSNHIKKILFKSELEAAQNSSDQNYEAPEESLRTDYSIDFSDETDSKSKVDREASDGGEDIWRLPLPPGASNKEPEDDFDGYSTSTVPTTADSDHGMKGTTTTFTSTSSHLSDKEISERNVSDMKIILEILYRIFGRLWVFREIQAAFHAMPTVENVDLPFTLHVPKPKFKEELASVTKFEKSGKKPVASMKSPEELETERQLHKNDYILPLQASEEAKAYMKMVVGLSSERSVSAKGGKGGKK